MGKGGIKVKGVVGANLELQHIINQMSFDSQEAKSELLNEFGRIGVEEWKNEIIKQDFVDTGDLRDSIAVKSIEDSDVTISPKGKNRHGVRNGEVAFILNYGNGTIPASHYVDTAKENIKAKTIARAKEILAEQIGKEGR